MAAARRDREPLLNAVHAALRVEPPVQSSPCVVVRDTEIGGAEVPTGALRLLLLGSANDDERRLLAFSGSDPARGKFNRHLALGSGRDFCRGAPVARCEAGIALAQLLSRLDNVGLARPNAHKRLANLAIGGFNRFQPEFETNT
jgi:hypothetical protein